MELKYTTFELKAKDGLLVTRSIGRKIKSEICDQLELEFEHTVLVVDFQGVKFIDASCADEIVVRVMARIEAGEFPDRFVIFKNIAEQHNENISMALAVAEKMVISYHDRKWSMLGSMNEGYRSALLKVVQEKEITARELQIEMDYRAVNEASTKLSKLYDKGLIAREPFREAVRGGGRQFRYISLLRDIKD